MSDLKRYSTLKELAGVLRFEWRSRRAWRSRTAMARGLWWSLVRRYPCELCSDCGRPVGRDIGDTYWHATDDGLWNDVMGEPGWEERYGEMAYLGVPGTVCCGCFTRRADAKGMRVYWTPLVSSRHVELANTPAGGDSE